MAAFLLKIRQPSQAYMFRTLFSKRHTAAILKFLTTLVICASAVGMHASHAQQSTDVIPNYPEIKVSKRGKERPSDGVKLSSDDGLDGAIVGIVLSSKHAVATVPNAGGAKRPRVLVSIPANLDPKEICMQVRSGTGIYGVAHEYTVPDKYASTTVELEYPTDDSDFLRESSVETIAIRLTQGSCSIPPPSAYGKPRARFLVPAWNVDRFQADDDILVLVQGGGMGVQIGSGAIDNADFVPCERVSAGNNPLFNHICRIQRSHLDLHHIDFIYIKRVVHTLSFSIFGPKTGKKRQ